MPSGNSLPPSVTLVCTPKDVLQVGKRLIELGDNASVRSGVSRIYYALHLIGVEQLAPKYNIPLNATGDNHSAVWRTLQGKGRTEKKVGQVIQKLSKCRAHADYHLSNLTRNSNCEVCTGKIPFVPTDLLDDALECFADIEKLLESEEPILTRPPREPRTLSHNPFEALGKK